MKALIIGYGGIGENVYHPELAKLGYDVVVVDPLHPDADYRDVVQVGGIHDIAVICTPNHTHLELAAYAAGMGVRRIFVEKPGVRTADEWAGLCIQNPATAFHVVKNNLYRDNYGGILESFARPDVHGVAINWVNRNRVPNPGGWSTNSDKAFGGVSRDLMPHLYCFAVKVFGAETLNRAVFSTTMQQNWTLSNVGDTDYGVVYPSGVYDVDDAAHAFTWVDGVALKMSTSWKEGYDDQSIAIRFVDGTFHKWEFGLCPSDAYGEMLQDTSNSDVLDLNLHRFVESFK